MNHLKNHAKINESCGKIPYKNKSCGKTLQKKIVGKKFNVKINESCDFYKGTPYVNGQCLFSCT